MSYQFQSICDQGAFRSNNEDAIKYGVENDGKLVWMVIADGMGGHLAGEVASQMLIDEIEQAIVNVEKPETIDWLCWLEIEINRANNKIYVCSKKNVEQKGMGTTCVVAICIGNDCYLGWVGDSRCYLYDPQQDDQLSQLTVDHTMVQSLLDKGAISEKEAKNANNKNLLSKAIGVKKGIDVDTKRITFNNSVTLLLSTDGLHDSLPEAQLLSSMQAISKGKDMTKELVKWSIDNGSKDNITYGSFVIDEF